MKRVVRICGFVISTYFIGGALANIYLNWPMDMPRWLYHATMFTIRVTGLGEVDSNDDAEVMATIIVACISWTLTGIVLWQLSRAVRRLRSRRKT
jgi:hypothetical protein